VDHRRGAAADDGQIESRQIGEIFRARSPDAVAHFRPTYVFNFSGMASSLAKERGDTAFIIVAPILGFIGVACRIEHVDDDVRQVEHWSAHTRHAAAAAADVQFGRCQIGNRAPQTASVGVSTSKFVRKAT
jgi:hypothetical protein